MGQIIMPPQPAFAGPAGHREAAVGPGTAVRERGRTVLSEQGVEFDYANGMNSGPGGTVPTRQDPWAPQYGQVNTRHFFGGSDGTPDFDGNTQPAVFCNW
jgi:hypothetical protein